MVEDLSAVSWAPRSSSTALGELLVDSSTAAVRTEGGGAAEAERPFASSSGCGCAFAAPRALATDSLGNTAGAMRAVGGGEVNGVEDPFTSTVSVWMPSRVPDIIC